MAKASVPSADSEPLESGDRESTDRFDELTFKGLEADLETRNFKIEEAKQRHSIRWWAVVVSGFLLFILLILLIYVVLKLPHLLEQEASPVIVVALYIAPMAAMVALSVTLTIAAFRGTKDGDEQIAANALSEGAKTTGLIN
jgi:uncharacterized integral membrane protein